MTLKTRQLDFSALDNRSYLYNDRMRRNEAIKDFAGNMSNLFMNIGEQRRAAQRQKQVDIAEGMSFDTNLTSNYIINNAIADYYQKNIKEPWVRQMQSKKGGVTAVDKNTLQTQKQALLNMANAGKAFTKNIENMKTMMRNPKNANLYEYDFDEVQRTLQDVADGEIGLEDFVTTDFSTNYDTGMPFVNLKAIDPDTLEAAGVSAFKKSTGKSPVSREIETMEGGKKVVRGEKEIAYGPYEELSGEMVTGIKANPASANIIKGLKAKLSDEDKAAAVEMFPEKDPNDAMLNYYYGTKRRPELESKIAPDVEEIYKEKLVDSSKGGAGSGFEIPVTKDQWDMRGKPQRLSGKIDVAYKDGEKIEVVSNRSLITRLNYGKIPDTDKTGLYATVYVPKSGSDIDQRIKEGEEISSQEMLKEMLKPGKSELVYVPYEDVKDVLGKYNFKDIEKYEGREDTGPGFEWD